MGSTSLNVQLVGVLISQASVTEFWTVRMDQTNLFAVSLHTLTLAHTHNTMIANYVVNAYSCILWCSNCLSRQNVAVVVFLSTLDSLNFNYRGRGKKP